LSGQHREAANAIPARQIRAVYDDRTVRVYQAYSHEIADAALARGTFVSPPFKLDRMTWVKPSFLWMMYRSGWGLKDSGQARILAIDVDREGFDWALAHGELTHHPSTPTEAPTRRSEGDVSVRIQWDPERDLRLRALPHRTIQIGLRGQAVTLYVGRWIRRIGDVTGLAHRIHALVTAGEPGAAASMLPRELPYESPAARALTRGDPGGHAEDAPD
jgi:hypothetical protein